ncbi:MAG: ATPase P [bacterium]
MIRIPLPGSVPVELNHLVCDFNGTLAVDGRLVEGVAERLVRLAKVVPVTVLTSDTVGTAQDELATLPVSVKIVETGREPGEEAAAKRTFAEALGPGVVFLGNGANDVGGVETATLSIVVLGREGAAGKAIASASLVVSSPVDALDLLLHPSRMISGLRQ